MFNFPFSKKTKINGIIGFLGLESFWLSCTPQEQEMLTRFYGGRAGSISNTSPIKGKIFSSSNTKLKYLTDMVRYASSEKQYALADKIIDAGINLADDTASMVDTHFFLQEAAEYYYKQKDFRPDAIELTKKFCLKDIQLFPRYSTALQQEIGFIPFIKTFQRLVILYEKSGQYNDAINICNLALEYELSDSTKGGYKARLHRLQKIINE